MSNRKAIGQLKSTSRVDIEWEIPDFLSLPAEVDECHGSSTFTFFDSSWYLKLYPNGQKYNYSEGYVGVCVFREDSGPPVSATYSLFFKRTDGREEIMNEDKRTFKEEGWGKGKAIKRSDLIDQKCKFLPSGLLTITCSMKCGETRGAEGTTKLARDFEGLLVSGDESDVTVEVQSQEFRLHRAVLAARTPVLSSMFKHDMKEKATGIVKVVDCEAGPFRTFVQYLYTGSTYGISTENVFALYGIADKYQVDELKGSCLDCMKLTLRVDTFCETLGLALQHGEKDLVELATEFLSENSSDIMGTNAWQNLMICHAKEISELLMQAFRRKDEKLAGAVKK